MQKELLPQAAQYASKRKRRKVWHKVVGSLACVVVFVTTYMLILPALTMEQPLYCGTEVHQHGDDCYTQRLICGYDTADAHVHTENCYEEQQVLVCQQEEGPGHIHDENCVQTERTLVCTEDHEHTDACFEETETYICGMTEDEGGHTHGPECYETRQVLACGKQEMVHIHTAECYEAILTCELPEHEHSLACYSDPDADVEQEKDWESSVSSVELTGVWSDDVIAIAQSQLGTAESSRNYIVTDAGEMKGITRYGQWYGAPYGDWCAMFVSFCLHYAGVEDFPTGANCNDWVDALKEAGLYAEKGDYIPSPGDLVFFDVNADGTASHTGIVWEITETCLKTIEGNSGDTVAQREYMLPDDSILGYGLLPEGAAPEITTQTAVIYTDSSYGTLAEDATVITLTGRIPENAEVRAFPVAVDTEEQLLCAYDIAIILPDGTLFEPPENEQITISIQSSDLNTDEDLEMEVYYVPEEGDPELINSEIAEDSISFDTDHFSVYMVLAVKHTIVTTQDELKAAIEAGKEYIQLGDDIAVYVTGDNGEDNGYIDEPLIIPAGVSITIELNGHRLLQRGTGALFFVSKEATLTIIDSKHPEAHAHTEECISLVQLLTCEDSAPDHAHTDECYTYEEIYICGYSGDPGQESPDGTVLRKAAVTDDCRVTVIYGPEAEIPEEAELSVSTYLPGTAEYEDQYNRFLTTFAECTGEPVEYQEEAPVDFLHFFQVEFLVDGTKIEPKSEVTVQFEFTQTELPGECAVIHYADAGTEILTQPDVWILDLEDGGKAVCFSLESFSDVTIFGDEAIPFAVETADEPMALAEEANTSVTVKKVWEDGNNAHDGESVTFTLYNNDVSTGQTLELNAENNWTGTFDGLADDGTYTVRETVPSGWYTESTCEESVSGGTYWIPATSFEEGGIYTFAYNTNSTPTADSTEKTLTAGTVTKGTGSITMNGETYDDYLTEVPENAQWTARSTGETSTLLNVGRSRYLRQNSATSYNTAGSPSSASAVTLKAWQSGGFCLQTTYSSTTYYLQNYNTATTFSSSATQYYLYRQVSTPTTTEITYTVTNKKLAGGGSIGAGSDVDYVLGHEKYIDAFRDGVDNPDTDLDDTATDLSDLYRLYLNAGIRVDMTPIDMVIVIDRSGSMDKTDVTIGDSTLARDTAVTMVLNGSTSQATADGLIGQFLSMNSENQIAVTSFFGDQSVSSTASGGYSYTKDSEVLLNWTGANTFVDAANRYNNGTNYEAGLLSASDLFKQVANDDHKKVMVFLSDGVPTYYIDDSGNRMGNGNYGSQSNVDLCRYPSKVAYDVFQVNNPNVITYTIGVSQDINSTSLEGSTSPDVLKYISGEDKFYGVATYQELYSALEMIITNNVGFFHPLSISDTLSPAVELADNPDFKATMKRADNTIVVLYENESVTADGEGIVRTLTYDKATRTVNVLFTPNYRMEFNAIYEVSFNVKTTEQAYQDYAQNLGNGLDGYGGVTGDPATDYRDNTTSSEKPGFHSNLSADLVFEWQGSEYDLPYDHPVVQVAACGLNIRKTALNGGAGLGGAEFDLYRKAVAGETGVSLYTLDGKVYDEADSFVKVNSASIVTGADGSASVANLTPGVYYLVETKAPDGYNALDAPRKITLTRTAVTTPTGDSMLEGSTVGVESIPTLTVKNSDGYKLPETGGIGTAFYTTAGTVLAMSAALLLLHHHFKRRREESASS